MHKWAIREVARNHTELAFGFLMLSNFLRSVALHVAWRRLAQSQTIPLQNLEYHRPLCIALP